MFDTPRQLGLRILLLIATILLHNNLNEEEKKELERIRTALNISRNI